MILDYTLISDVWELVENSILNRQKHRSSVISNIQKTTYDFSILKVMAFCIDANASYYDIFKFSVTDLF